MGCQDVTASPRIQNIKKYTRNRMSFNKLTAINRCLDLIKEYNPKLYSIDTFCLEKLGDYSSKV